MTRTSRPSSTPPTATPTRTCRRSTARSASRRRWRRARPRRTPCRTTSGRPRTATAASTSPTTRSWCRRSSRRTSRSRSPSRSRRTIRTTRSRPSAARAEDFRVDTFDVSYGDPQTVAVVAKRALSACSMRYRIDGGRTRTAGVSRVAAAVSATATRTTTTTPSSAARSAAPTPATASRSGSRAQKKGRGGIESERFTYRLAPRHGRRRPVIANEDYTGVNPTYPAGTNAPKYAQAHRRAIRQAGYSADVWDVDADGVPHDLGVLDHYDAVAVVPRRQPDHPGPGGRAHPRRRSGTSRTSRVAERQQYLTMRGARLPQRRRQADPRRRDRAVRGPARASATPSAASTTGSTATRRRSASSHGRGLLRRLPDPGERLPPVLPRGVSRGPTSTNPRVGRRHRRPIEGFLGRGGSGATPTTRSTRRACSSRPARCCRWTSSRSSRAGGRPSTGRRRQQPVPPIEGARYAAALHADDSYMRLTKTVDLPAGGDRLSCAFQLSISTESDYDHVFVEARTAGGDDWTTLPEANGGDADDPPGGVHRERVPAPAAPVPASLPRRGGLQCSGHDRHVEHVHGLDRRLAAGGVRPLRLRRAARSRCRSRT